MQAFATVAPNHLRIVGVDDVPEAGPPQLVDRIASQPRALRVQIDGTLLLVQDNDRLATLGQPPEPPLTVFESDGGFGVAQGHRQEVGGLANRRPFVRRPLARGGRVEREESDQGRRV